MDVSIVELAKIVETLGEPLDEVALSEEVALGGLLARLDLDGGAFMFEAEEEGTGMFEILR